MLTNQVQKTYQLNTDKQKESEILEEHPGFFHYTIICFTFPLPLRNWEKAVECKLHFN